jgi:hypothetical protein
VTKRNFIAVNQYGTTLYGLASPRADLLRKVGATKAKKMYIDHKGKTLHVGYVIRDEWWTIYEVIPWTSTGITPWVGPTSR